MDLEMHRTSSLPTLTDYMSRLKVFSGRADKDEVSNSLKMDKPSLSLDDRTSSPTPAKRPWQLRGKSNRFRRALSIDVTPRVLRDLHVMEETDSLSPLSSQIPILTQTSGSFSSPSTTISPSSYSATTTPSSDPSAASFPSPASSATPTPPPYATTRAKHVRARTLDEQSNDLILAAFNRGRTPSGFAQGSGTSTPTSKSVATSKPTAGALAALGLRAAGAAAPAAAPTIVPAAPAPVLRASAPTPPESAIATEPPSTLPSKVNKSFLVPSKPVGGSQTRSESNSRSASRKDEATSRSPSPFFRARKAREERRERSPSPDIVALRKDSMAAESDAEGIPGTRGRGRYRPRSSAYDSPESSGNEAEDYEAQTERVRIAEKPVEKEVAPPIRVPQFDDHDDDIADDEDEPLDYDDDDLWDPETFFDEETEKNTEANALYADSSCENSIDKKTGGDNFDVFGEDVEQDVLGEGPNVVVPPDPLFTKPSDKVKKSERSGLDLVTSRPTFARDRCTINITQGDPDGVLDVSGKRMRRYVVLSDLSEESRYAVEWAIGTVARDGDEIFLISVMENEDKVDPKSWSSKHQTDKLKVQKERQTTALLLVRQVTGLLERTRLNITVTCQAMHAKNARYMLLDLIDFLEPTLVIVGSRGLGQLKGILLGSTSHYLVQKSSVPVMVARRRLRRPLRRTNPEDLRRSPRVSLASANIEKTAPTKQEDDIMDAADDDDDEPEAATAK